MMKIFRKNDLVISAISYNHNIELMKLSIKQHTHFIDLGGNNTVVTTQKRFHKKPVIISFDDSFKSIFKFAFPILSKYGFTASIFIISDNQGDLRNFQGLF